MTAVHPTRVAQVALAIDDLERAKRFYGEVLGLRHLFDAPPGLVFFQCGETRLMLSRPEAGRPRGNSVLYYGVKDVDATYAALSGKGVAFDGEPHTIAKVEGKDIRLAIFRDSEGNMLGLISG